MTEHPDGILREWWLDRKATRALARSRRANRDAAERALGKGNVMICLHDERGMIDIANGELVWHSKVYHRSTP